MSIIKF